MRIKRPATVEELRRDNDLQDIISLNLSRAVQLSVDIAVHILSEGDSAVPRTMKESFDALAEKQIIPTELATRMRKSVGFRNTVVHNYQATDWQIVYNICHKNLVDFKTFIISIDKLI